MESNSIWSLAKATLTRTDSAGTPPLYRTSCRRTRLSGRYFLMPMLGHELLCLTLPYKTIQINRHNKGAIKLICSWKHRPNWSCIVRKPTLSPFVVWTWTSLTIYAVSRVSTRAWFAFVSHKKSPVPTYTATNVMLQHRPTCVTWIHVQIQIIIN